MITKKKMDLIQDASSYCLSNGKMNHIPAWLVVRDATLYGMVIGRLPDNSDIFNLPPLEQMEFIHTQITEICKEADEINGEKNET